MELYRQLSESISWEPQEIRLFGKMIPVPRLVAWYGDSSAIYSYSGITMEPLSWTDTLLEIKEEVEDFASAEFNSVLLNWYRNGNDSMGWHADDEKELGKNPTIASLSLGGTRPLHFKHRTAKLPNVKLLLEGGSLLIMSGNTQEHWKHQIPKSKTFDAPRINLTFRKIY